MKFKEEKLKEYTEPLSETEQKTCINAIIMIADALKPLGFFSENEKVEPFIQDTYSYCIKLKNINKTREITLLLQGSFANDTNIKGESDVDIAVIKEEFFFKKLRENVTDKDYNFKNAEPEHKIFKYEVKDLLSEKFGDSVELKNKSIRVYGTYSRKDADVVPCYRYRDYSKDYRINPENYIPGTLIITEKKEIIINYPEKHILNGKKKNMETQQWFKKMVKIIKNIRVCMKEYYFSAKNVSSFMLESLVWNIPSSLFINDYNYTYNYKFKLILSYIYKNRNKLNEYKEINGIKPLCPTKEARENLKKFIEDLKEFFE